MKMKRANINNCSYHTPSSLILIALKRFIVIVNFIYACWYLIS